jgi:hypothetical protein
MAQPAHPVITFQVNLEVNDTEAVGPNTNLVNPHILHPMRHQDDQDNAITEKNNIRNTRGLWLPGLLAGENLAGSMGVTNIRNRLGHGDRFTVKGLKAIYIKDTYTSGVTGDNSSSPLYVYSTDPDDSVHPEDTGQPYDWE